MASPFALAYFVPLDSHLGGGQSIGKRLLRIRVAGRSGLPIGPARAAPDARTVPQWRSKLRGAT